jgi:hypothetical protein
MNKRKNELGCKEVDSAKTEGLVLGCNRCSERGGIE